jgi:hypothetical protein
MSSWARINALRQASEVLRQPDSHFSTVYLWTGIVSRSIFFLFFGLVFSSKDRRIFCENIYLEVHRRAHSTAGCHVNRYLSVAGMELVGHPVFASSVDVQLME